MISDPREGEQPAGSTTTGRSRRVDRAGYPRGIARPRARISPTSGKIVYNKIGTTEEKYKVSRVSRALVGSTEYINEHPEEELDRIPG